MKFTKLLIIISTSLLFSCSNYINKMYNDLDRDQVRRNPPRQDQFQRFRNPTAQNNYHNQLSRPVANNYQNDRNRPPQVRRNYKPQSSIKKRYTADDLTDTSRNDSSLWAGKGRQKHLFTAQKDKKHGDIILVNVKKTLKNDMTLELKKAFPDYPKVAKAPEKDEKKEQSAQPENDDQAKSEKEGKVYDRISSVVIEEINEGHLLLRGQKSVLFKKRKRLVEIQALVSRRDITDSDTIDSDKMLETSVHILR
ncbi:flagellar basal body L-ring protein FlgH [Halobacteriovorax sp. HLS]|uniref:flagellar basal body L-ring protein FlgH n=1 Tax=Halobacteriovorax sp. HLS TaxID=2234000 RepID=UPI000FDC9ADC|nr:flagellar basal body L-ring protein FlgH [Halobacteriovorax sp. HLS]